MGINFWGGAGLIIIKIFLVVSSIEQSLYYIGPIVVLDFFLGAFLGWKVKELKVAMVYWIVANIALLIVASFASVILMMYWLGATM